MHCVRLKGVGIKVTVIKAWGLQVLLSKYYPSISVQETLHFCKGKYSKHGLTSVWW